MKKALVLGAGGFIGAHLVTRLKSEGFWVRGVDIKFPPYNETNADDFLIGDLRDPLTCSMAIDQNFDEVYQLAADMGGAGFIFVGTNDYDIMHNSAQINLNVIEACRKRNLKRIFIHHQPAFIQNIINDPETRMVKSLHILLHLILNMAGKNYLVKGFI